MNIAGRHNCAKAAAKTSPAAIAIAGDAVRVGVRESSAGNAGPAGRRNGAVSCAV